MSERKAERPGAMMYFELIPAFDSMTDETAGRFIKGILHYAKDAREPDFSDNQVLTVLWSIVRVRLDRDSERYKAVSLGNSQKRLYGAYKAKRREQGLDYVSFQEWKQRVRENYDDSFCADE